MAVLASIQTLVQTLVYHSITRVVICPGSRSAALTIALVRHPSIQTEVVMDERAAAYIALGMAQVLKEPVALVCTSGTAAYNFAPAVAEAFFLKVPLLVLTADRPPEWIHQQDGQTIYQNGMYGGHVKKSFTFPDTTSHPDQEWHATRIANEACLLTYTGVKGPVHINVPIREPFYPTENETYDFSTNGKMIQQLPSEQILSDQVWQQIRAELSGFRKVLIGVGQHITDSSLIDSLNRVIEQYHIPVLADVTGNMNRLNKLFAVQDTAFINGKNADMAPDLLITFGDSFLSKSFKQLIRSSNVEHWHIGIENSLIDSFQKLTKLIPVEPTYFFEKLVNEENIIGLNDQKEYQLNLDTLQGIQFERYNRLLNSSQDFSAVHVIAAILKKLPANAQLHLGNSMSVRYVNLLAGLYLKNQTVYSNRGTSGIDGCVSTAIGAARVALEPVYVLVGDVTFFYDRNGLLLSDLPTNLRIVVLNNGGGVIFRMINGPATQPERDEYFETRHDFTAARTAIDSKVEYFSVANEKDFHHNWDAFENATCAALMEVFTDPESDRVHYKAYFKD